MIRINLLPVKRAKKRGAGQQQLLVFAIVLIVLFLLLFTFKSKEDEQITSLKAKQSSIKEEMARLEDLIGDINTFQKKSAALQKKLDVIELLRKGKSGPVRILDELSTVIPKKVWLANLVESHKTLNMEGFATDNREIAIFMKNLEASMYFSDVTLLSITQVSKANVYPMPVMKFVLKCKYKIPQS